MENITEQNFIEVFKNSLKITPRTISIKTLLSERNLRRIDYKPYYQRNYVWDNVKQSFFIESVILGTEIPPLILFKSGTNIEVIDGRQRFETLKKFIENDIILTEKGLMSLPALAKLTFNKLKDDIKEIFWNSNIRVYEFEVIVGISSNLEDRIKKEIFRRYNTGITPLTNVEVDAAKYDKDQLSSFFEKHIKKDSHYYEGLKKCFFPNESDSPDLIEKMIDFKRKSFILSKFPIIKYATGSQRSEIISILYETTVQNLEEIEIQGNDFINQVKQVISLHDQFSKFGFNPKFKFIYESILWAIRILEQEDVIYKLDSNIEQIVNHYKNNLEKYSDENSFFYKNIIERFLDTAKLFESISGFSFDLYIKRNEFKDEIKELRQSDSDVEDVMNVLESLRINKPSPVSKPIEEILSDVVTNKYLIRPSYQRQEKISVLKASSIIESILLGINLPPIFIFKCKNGVKEVIDGQQRLLSVISFLGKQYRNEKDDLTYSTNNSFKLKGLKILNKLNGYNYSSLIDIDKDKILDFVIDEIVIEESLNDGFEPTDLFIRLNQKPYPINNNSFEMWNSTVDKEVINKIKEVTEKHVSWFYTKENLTGINRTDRMENEELITILTYLSIQMSKEDSYDKTLGLFKRSDRITCRLKNKTALTDYLIKLDENVTEKDLFIKSINRTEELVVMFGSLFASHPTKEQINNFFNVKKAKIFRRSYQDFYITWMVLVSLDKDFITNNPEMTKNLILKLLGKLRNVENQIVDEIYFENFLHELNNIVINKIL
ncbi:DUF262 domain-containing protein [Flavobacterium sp.]|uniref:DUF262 domain-containing protein n=3 Tax=Flavobacterium sp. TaxID=239 RepID=UPI004047CE47